MNKEQMLAFLEDWVGVKAVEAGDETKLEICFVCKMVKLTVSNL